ncbi:MAG: ABC transporter permease, partial [Oscillospiraceae bacterium]|nr:ABC transporter permease [Oscillospiraceae bacterium]
IGLILAFMTLLMSLTSVVKGNGKTIAMMKVFGYSRKECSGSVLDGYRPVTYIGFIIGTAYQYFLLRIMVDIVFADYEDMPAYSFDFKALAISLVAFIAAYEIILYIFGRKLDRQSVKSIMLE